MRYFKALPIILLFSISAVTAMNNTTKKSNVETSKKHWQNANRKLWTREGQNLAWKASEGEAEPIIATTTEGKITLIKPEQNNSEIKALNWEKTEEGWKAKTTNEISKPLQKEELTVNPMLQSMFIIEAYTQQQDALAKIKRERERLEEEATQNLEMLRKRLVAKQAGEIGANCMVEQYTEEIKKLTQCKENQIKIAAELAESATTLRKTIAYNEEQAAQELKQKQEAEKVTPKKTGWFW